MAVFAFSYLHSLSELTCDGFVPDNLPEEDEVEVFNENDACVIEFRKNIMNKVSQKSTTL